MLVGAASTFLSQLHGTNKHIAEDKAWLVQRLAVPLSDKVLRLACYEGFDVFVDAFDCAADSFCGEPSL
jgi:hypothetical protein